MDSVYKIVVVIAMIILVVIAIVVFFFSNTSMADAKIRDAFSSGCLKYCNEIQQAAQSSEDIGRIAIDVAKGLEGSEFMKACKLLNPDINYPWQCWNRQCCKFNVYPPV